MSKTCWRTKGVMLTKRLMAILLPSFIWGFAWKYVMPESLEVSSVECMLRATTGWIDVWIGVAVYNRLRGNQKLL